MSSQDPVTRGEVTRLLDDLRHGRSGALDRLLSVLYDELRTLAGSQLRRERPEHTLRATALVHEAYLKLSGGVGLDVADRSHFMAVAARAMRQVLVDHARRRSTAKRGGGLHRTTLTDGTVSVELRAGELLALDQALEGLEERQRQVVEMRFFAEMEESEIAHVLGVSERTVRRDWVKARAWLYRLLYPGDTDGRGKTDPAEA